IAHANLPWKLTQHKTGSRSDRVEVDVRLAEHSHSRLADGTREHRQRAERPDEIPVPLVFAQIAESLIGIEEQVLVPTEDVIIHLNFANLKSDHLIKRPVERAA